MANHWIGYLATVLVRTLLLALIAATVLRIGGHRLSAAVRHAIWTLVLIGTLALLAGGSIIPPASVRILAPPASPSAAGQPVIAVPGDPGDTAVLASAPLPHREPAPIDWQVVVFAGYLFAGSVLLIRVVAGCLLVRQIIKRSQPTGIASTVRECDSIAVPLTAGWLRSTILLPAGWRAWNPAKLSAVPLHQGAHVQRRDSLIRLLATLNRCLLWFHPLAWWLERQLGTLAEEACDEACLRRMPDRAAYAQVVLEMTAAVRNAGGRIYGHVLAMANASHTGRRVAAILNESRRTADGLTRAGRVTLLLASVPLIYASAAVQLDRQPSLLPLDFRAWKPPAPRVMLAEVRPPAPVPVQSTVETVALQVTVRDPFGRFVSGLTQASFHVFEDGIEQPITRFSNADRGSSIMLVAPGRPAASMTMREGNGLLVVPANGTLVEQIRAAIDAAARTAPANRGVLVIADDSANAAYTHNDLDALTRVANLPISAAGTEGSAAAGLLRELANRTGGS